eukprot:TRINITY_DN3941_c0_g1_i1.p1 TRINITY_DN3941_c0_g1~~TRINITY_DN3941_c0_g1_i1.p1  ORF type:complete len:115 (-),score=16.94 TRINITY_DN3941_c0_g1_i1:42-386(-)
MSQKFKVEANFIKFDVPSPEEELLKTIPATGLGTVNPLREAVDDGYAALVLLVLGVFYFFPWIICMFFYFSPNHMARFCAIMAGVLVVVTLCIMVVSITTLNYVPFFSVLLSQL